MLERQPDLKTAFLCMDNDKAGQSAAQRIAELLQGRGVNTGILIPTLKDWNEDLCAQYEQAQAPPTVLSYEQGLS